MNNFVLYGMINQLRRFTEMLVDLSHRGKLNMSTSEWESCMSDAVLALIIIEKYVKCGMDDEK